ncbi:MAG TPA: signal peptidase II [Streptosporangiaceae bacterium]
MRDLQAAGGTPLTSQPAGEPDRPEETGASRSTSPRIAILLGVALLVLVLDIISKTIVVATLSDRLPLRLLGGLLTLRESRNPGAAFSIGGTSTTILFSAIAVGVVIFIVRASRRIYSLAWAIALGLLLGGAMGNLTDRIFRSPAPFRGWVVDWIQVPHWPVFNLADSAICCGGALMVLLAARGHGIEGSARPVQPPGPPAQPGRPRPSQPDQPHPSGGGSG